MAGRRGLPRFAVPGMGLVLRLSLSLATIGIAVLTNNAFLVVPWALVVTAADTLIVILRTWRPDLAEAWMLGLIAGLTALAAVALQAAGTPALLLILIPAIHAGLSLGLSGALVVGWVNLIVGYAMTIATQNHQFEGVSVIVWMTVAFVATLVASLWRIPPPGKDLIAAQEAKALLIRLGSLADSLDTGFDLPALGDWALSEIDEQVGIERGAVLLRTEGDAVVIGLRGQTRMPWPAPTQPDSALHRTWKESVSVRGASGLGPARSFILTVPLVSADGSAVGMVAVDRSSHPFSSEDQRSVEGIANRIEPLVEVGVLFSRLRGRAAVEERARLARDMHDGVAQELAALAFTVDSLVARTPAEDPVSIGLESLRVSMRQSLGDLRNQISTLRMVERPGVSLGAVLSTTLQEFATNTGVRTSMTLDESPFRFPAHVEMQVQRLALDVLADARASGATFVDWNVWLSAPNARILLTHDGAPGLDRDTYASHPLIQHGEVIVDSLIPTGLYVELVLGGDPPGEGVAPPTHEEAGGGDEVHLSHEAYPEVMASPTKDALSA
ncbi:MAG: histidine kinase [Intrasporangiaceae bacterium]|nr:histidine kinase [Intrasporangiaceae bacterium]